MKNASIKILEKIAASYPYLTEKKTTPTYASPEYTGASTTSGNNLPGRFRMLTQKGRFDREKLERMLGAVARPAASPSPDLTWMKWMPPTTAAKQQMHPLQVAPKKQMQPLPVAPKQQLQPLQSLTAR